jgi:hypothetical protein
MPFSIHPSACVNITIGVFHCALSMWLPFASKFPVVPLSFQMRLVPPFISCSNAGVFNIFSLVRGTFLLVFALSFVLA